MMAEAADHPTPWKTEPYGPYCRIGDANGVFVGQVLKAQAERIVAAVNATAEPSEIGLRDGGTPRCDDFFGADDYRGAREFARQLERELAEAKELVRLASSSIDEEQGIAVRQQQRAEQAEAEVAALKRDAESERDLRKRMEADAANYSPERLKDAVLAERVCMYCLLGGW